MKTIVFAYQDFGCQGLEAVLNAGFEVEAVFTLRDDPNEQQFFGSVATFCSQRGIAVFAPENVNDPLWVERIRDMAPDVIFSFYYRKMLSQAILDIPTRGAYNLHGSLLPKYRGRAPLNWAIIHGEKETGLTFHEMVAEADAGHIVDCEKIAIEDADTAGTLHPKMVAAARRLLDRALPSIKSGQVTTTPQDHSAATYFPRRKPADGELDWNQSARDVHNMVRALTHPYPGAFTHSGTRKLTVWSSTPVDAETNAAPGTVISSEPLEIACGKGALRILSAQTEGGLVSPARQVVQEMGLVSGLRLGAMPKGKERKTRVLILGVNGFIGYHLSERLLKDGNYEVYGMDISTDAIQPFMTDPNFHFVEGDITIHSEWIEYHIKKCDVILPLVAIATPIQYTRNPLRVFELDFEENLKIIRHCVKYNKRVIFPSTSEVYGMCDDDYFDEETSRLIVGPINKPRWIYSASKQLLDRVIWAYGMRGELNFTLFRPFNWMGPRLDSLDSARIGSSRAITQLILNLVEGTPIKLIDGGEQKRCFTDIKEGADALFRIVENKGGKCDGQIINIGNPENEASIKHMAEVLLEKFEQHPMRKHFPAFAGFKVVENSAFYGKGYQDVSHRRPSIENAKRMLDWTPVITTEETIEETLDFFLNEAVKSL